MGSDSNARQRMRLLRSRPRAANLDTDGERITATNVAPGSNPILKWLER